MTKSKGIRVLTDRPKEVIQVEKDLRNRVTTFINGIVESELFISEIDRGETLYDSGVDSLDLAEFELLIETEYNIKFDPDDINIRNSFEYVITKTIQRINEQAK